MVKLSIAFSPPSLKLRRALLAIHPRLRRRGILAKESKTTPGKMSNERVKTFCQPISASTCLHMELNNITVLENMVSLHHLAIVNILSPYLSILQFFQEILVDFRSKIL